MADNSAYAFGLDFYEGNSVRDWGAISGWPGMAPAFAYFRLGIGLHKDNMSLLTQAATQTKLRLGAYYELWLPDIPKDAQLKVIRDQLSLMGVAGYVSLPLWLAFEKQTEVDRHGNKTEAFPSVGDLQYMMASLSNMDRIVYCNEDGLKQIIGVLGSLPQDWNFAIASYGADTADENGVDTTLTHLAATYGLTKSRIFFMQVTQKGPYPAGASYDKGADYDRAVSYDLGAVAPGADIVKYTVNVAPTAKLNLRAGPSTNTAIIGGLITGSEVGGKLDASGQFLHIDAYASLQYLSPILPPPQPIPAPNPAPTPTPTPAPPPSNGLGLYYLNTRAEYMKASGKQLTPGTFSAIGGESQANFVGLGDNESAWIYTLGQNGNLRAWSQGLGHIYRTDITSFPLPWPVILAASITGLPRAMVHVVARLPHGKIQLEAIPRTLDYSAYNLAVQPWLFGVLGTIYKDGHDGPGVKDGIPFIMPYFDPSTFPGPAGRDLDAQGLTVDETVLFGPVPNGADLLKAAGNV